jgi:hypothetical protein
VTLNERRKDEQFRFLILALNNIMCNRSGEFDARSEFGRERREVLLRKLRRIVEFLGCAPHATKHNLRMPKHNLRDSLKQNRQSLSLGQPSRKEQEAGSNLARRARSKTICIDSVVDHAVRKMREPG